jgi:hypothetical protein
VVRRGSCSSQRGCLSLDLTAGCICRREESWSVVEVAGYSSRWRVQQCPSLVTGNRRRPPLSRGSGSGSLALSKMLPWCAIYQACQILILQCRQSSRPKRPTLLGNDACCRLTNIGVRIQCWIGANRPRNAGLQRGIACAGRELPGTRTLDPQTLARKFKAPSGQPSQFVSQQRYQSTRVQRTS